jgi:hypothetical protein
VKTVHNTEEDMENSGLNTLALQLNVSCDVQENKNLSVGHIIKAKIDGSLYASFATRSITLHKRYTQGYTPKG